MYNLQKTGIYTGLFNFLMQNLLLSRPSKQKSVRGKRETAHLFIMFFFIFNKIKFTCLFMNYLTWKKLLRHFYNYDQASELLASKI